MCLPIFFYLFVHFLFLKKRKKKKEKKKEENPQGFTDH